MSYVLGFSSFQWIAIVSLAIAVFEAVRANLRDRGDSRGRTLWIASFGALAAAILLAAVPLAYDARNNVHIRNVMRDDVLDLLHKRPKQFMTLDDLLSRVREKSPVLSAEVPLAPLLREVTQSLISEKKMIGLHTLWLYGSGPQSHCVTVYCLKCEIPRCL